MQWLMLQQDKPEDYVIATGEQHSVRDFVSAAAEELNMKIRWEGEGVDEYGVWEKSSGSEKIIEVDSDYFRPTEVQTLLGDASKAKKKLGWEPKISFRELVADMVQHDLELAKNLNQMS